MADNDDLMAVAARVRAQLTAAGAPFELTEVEINGHPLPAFRNAFPDMAALVASGRGYGDKEFMVYESDRWSFDRFYAAVDALAGRLQAELGVQPGDRIAIAMRNRPEWAVAFVASAMVGAVPAPLNSFGMHDELLAALQSVQPRLLFCDADRRQRLGASLAAAGITDVLVDAKPEAGSATLDFAALIAAGGPAVQSPTLGPDDPGLILFTSGASSRAKPVLSSQRAVCQALANIEYIGYSSAMVSPRSVEALMKKGLAPTTLTAVPLFHVSGLHAQLLASLRGGRRLVFMHRWSTARALELIREEKITQFNGAPSMVMQLLADPAFETEAATLGGLGFGGAGLPQRAIDDVMQRRPDSMSGIGFGMTESNGCGAAAAGDAFFRHPTSSGLLSPIVEVRVVAPDGSTVPAGETGELQLRGVVIMDRYWNDVDATAQALTRDGWLRTGDVGYLDAEGFLYVVDRIKDVINRSGEKIASAEIESCLLQLERVREVAVFAQPDDATGEAVVAAVVLAPGASISVEEIRAHVAARLGQHKAPRDVYLRSEPLPCNAAGKLLKTALKREYAPD